jgi:hypothetical protein
LLPSVDSHGGSLVKILLFQVVKFEFSKEHLGSPLCRVVFLLVLEHAEGPVSFPCLPSVRSPYATGMNLVRL